MGSFGNSNSFDDCRDYKNIFLLKMNEYNLLVGTEVTSIVVMALIFFKVLIFTPTCFNMGDTYFTLLPLFITKMIEFKLTVVGK